MNNKFWRIAIDLSLLMLFVYLLEPHLSGLGLHEGLGLVFVGVIGLHLQRQWRWIVASTRGLFRRRWTRNQWSYLLNTALLLTMITLTVSGVVISSALDLGRWLPETHGDRYRNLHIDAAALSLLIVAAHVALHARWILRTMRVRTTTPVGLVIVVLALSALGWLLADLNHLPDPTWDLREHSFDALIAQRQAQFNHESHLLKWLGMDIESEIERRVTWGNTWDVVYNLWLIAAATVAFVIASHLMPRFIFRRRMTHARSGKSTAVTES